MSKTRRSASRPRAVSSSTRRTSERVSSSSTACERSRRTTRWTASSLTTTSTPPTSKTSITRSIKPMPRRSRRVSRWIWRSGGAKMSICCSRRSTSPCTAQRKTSCSACRRRATCKITRCCTPTSCAGVKSRAMSITSARRSISAPTIPPWALRPPSTSGRRSTSPTACGCMSAWRGIRRAATRTRAHGSERMTCSRPN